MYDEADNLRNAETSRYHGSRVINADQVNLTRTPIQEDDDFYALCYMIGLNVATQIIPFERDWTQLSVEDESNVCSSFTEHDTHNC